MAIGMSVASILFGGKQNSNTSVKEKHILKKVKPVKQYEGLYTKAVADELYSKMKILCWVLTNPKTYRSKSDHIKNTWGKRCDKILFVSSEKDDILDTIAVAVKEGHDPLWDKTKNALIYIYHHHFNDYDWFVKADDDR
jgi:hypothetical protein